MNIKPVRLLKCDMEFTLEYPWDEAGSAWEGYAYKWDVTLTIPNPQFHSSPDTLTPYEYNGLDIKVGDWIAGLEGTAPLKIISITSASSNQVVCQVEDVERLNIFQDSTVAGVGRPTTTSGIVFELDDVGNPILGPLPPYYLDVTAQTNIAARFQYRNYIRKYVRVEQENHGFSVGDIISPVLDEPGTYEKSSSNVSLSIGVVTSVDMPKAGWFTFKPLGTLIENFEPGLVGNHGDLFYIDPANPGALTSTRPAEHIRPLYMRLETPNRVVQLNLGVEDSVQTKRFEADTVTNGQTEFVLPEDSVVVLEMSINGVDSDNFTFDAVTNTLTFDPDAEGFSLENTDSVSFLYRT